MYMFANSCNSITCHFHSLMVNLFQQRLFSTASFSHKKFSSVFLGLGSNLGGSNRISWIERALSRIHSNIGKVVNTSALYESRPAFISSTDSPENFLNCAIEIQTDKLPHDVILLLKDIEASFGRNSPNIQDQSDRVYTSRPIDIDILFWDNQVLDIRASPQIQLQVPHKQLQNRSFVLYPLNDIAPDYIHPIYQKSISILVSDLEGDVKRNGPRQDALLPLRVFPLNNRLIPLGDPAQIRDSTIAGVTGLLPSTSNVTFDLCTHGRHKNYKGLKSGNSALNASWPGGFPTQIMGILNVTPDSFSDGSTNFKEVDHLSCAIESLLAQGAEIIDVGGESTRPGSIQPSLQEELSRVIPVVEMIRQVNSDVCISIDTRRSEVAKLALDAGANLINDVSGGVFDEQMDSTVAQWRHNENQTFASYCIMHMRGDTSTMNELTDYSPEGVVEHTGKWIKSRIEYASRIHGLPRWRFVADPGLGFAKTASQNVLLSARAKEFRSYLPSGVPVLIGHSRKRFVREMIGESMALDRGVAFKRSMSVGGGVVLAIDTVKNAGVEIVRVHDVQELRSGLDVAAGLEESRIRG